MAFQRYMKPDYCMYPCLLGNSIAKSVNIPNLSAFLSNDNSNFISSRSTFTQTNYGSITSHRYIIYNVKPSNQWNF